MSTRCAVLFCLLPFQILNFLFEHSSSNSFIPWNSCTPSMSVAHFTEFPLSRTAVLINMQKSRCFGCMTDLFPCPLAICRFISFLWVSSSVSVLYQRTCHLVANPEFEIESSVKVHFTAVCSARISMDKLRHKSSKRVTKCTNIYTYNPYLPGEHLDIFMIRTYQGSGSLMLFAGKIWLVDGRPHNALCESLSLLCQWVALHHWHRRS